jgi:hypothetical protein
MNNYTPFLKLKSNEIIAIEELDTATQNNLVPFFDFPKNKEAFTEAKFITKVQRMKNSATKHLKNISRFYLDNFDIDSTLYIKGEYNLSYLLQEFKDLSIIPVVGIDRTYEHIQSVINAKDSSLIDSEHLAVRFTVSDFEDFELISDDIIDMLEEVMSKFNAIDLILDCRVCINLSEATLSSNIISFIKQFISTYPTNKIIVTGSSIPASISEVLSTSSEVEHPRNELSIFNVVLAGLDTSSNLFLGDYAMVSPDYSDIDIADELIRTITAAKIIYTFDNHHFIIRGKGLQHYGNGQYNDLAAIIVSKIFYRGETYSFGDNYLKEKSLGMGSQVLPGTIIKPSINTHIKYMMNDYIY